jgi:DNA (cytosine-5)-methyltransferase 1
VYPLTRQDLISMEDRHQLNPACGAGDTGVGANQSALCLFKPLPTGPGPAPTPSVISLFCGAGGLDLGFSNSGFEVAIAADYNQDAVDTHNLNSPRKVAVRLDLSSITAAELTTQIQKLSPGASPVGIIGGPPCQGFSRANTQRSHDDPRNDLARNYTRMINDLADHYPIEFFVFENVTGLLSDKNATVLAELKKTLSEKFDVFSTCLNAQNYGVPQSRERFFMVGLRKRADETRNYNFPTPTTPVPLTVLDAIGHLPEATFFQRSLRPHDIPHHPNHWTMRPLSKRFGPNLVTNGRSLNRLAWDKPSRTVAYGHREIHVHPSGLRRLSIFEAMLLQGFPSTYTLSGTLSGQVTQVSNAVPPPLARAISDSIRSIIFPQVHTVNRDGHD